MIFRNRSPNRFTTIPNQTIRDKDLSDSAGWLLINLLSNADDWKITIRSLAADGRFGSHDKINKSMKLLRELGYARLTRYASGETAWDFTDSKGEFEPHSENQDMGEPHSEKPDPEKPHPENQDVLRKNNKTEIPKETNCAFDPKKFLRDQGADQKLVDAWFVVRKTKKASNTEVALEAFVREVSKSGCDINTILRKCIEESWSGFKASWKWDQTQAQTNRKRHVVNPVRAA